MFSLSLIFCVDISLLSDYYFTAGIFSFAAKISSVVALIVKNNDAITKKTT
jgi:hypothetical protein